MVYVNLFDRVPKEEVLKRHKKAVILSAVNTNTDAVDAEHSILIWTSLHRVIRFDQFKSFHESVLHVITLTENLYLKYGGFCFLDDYEGEERFEFVKNHFDFLLKNYKDKIQFDPLQNNLLWSEGSNLRIFDKMVIKTILETGNLDLIYFRPIAPAFKEISAEDIHKFTEKDIMDPRYSKRII